MAAEHRILMCAPDHFTVEYSINPWMEGNIGRVDRAKARAQWEAYRAALSEVAEVCVLDQDPSLPDQVFTANVASVLGNRAVMARFYHPQRWQESERAEEWFRSQGFDVLHIPKPLHFEGTGDALLDRGVPVLWAGYGFRTSLETHRLLAERLEIEVVSLRLVDPRFYHLDVCLSPLPGGHLMYYPKAFDSASLREIEQRVPAERRVTISEQDALSFACNAVGVADRVYLHRASDQLRADLEERGLTAVEIDLSQFHCAGGSARCLVLCVTEPRLAPPRVQHSICEEEVEINGHLLNSGLMARVLDIITDNGCSFDILKFSAGQRPEDSSRVRLRLTAPRSTAMDSIIAQIKARGGGIEKAPRGASPVEVDQDGVAPPDFLVTTIYPTEVLIGRRWIEVEQRRMDATVVVDQSCDPPRAFARLMRDVRRGDLVVCGHEGVRVQVPRETAEERGEFAFMSSSVSSERRVEIEVERIAWEMRRIRDRGGKIVVVPGPVVIHTGGGPHLAALIRAGYIQALLGGNAIAAHDIEQSIYSTSLGVDLRSGHVVEGGHRHHLRVINEVRRHGSIAAAVEAGFIRAGVMHACVTSGIPFVLAGSIRDDGPLPDTVMDLIAGQRLYQEQVRGAQMILMLSTMLHAIGTGNMTPSGVRLICVDISPAVVTKLADRGSLESVGIVTDVGLFLSMLCAKLGLAAESETARRGHAA